MWDFSECVIVIVIARSLDGSAPNAPNSSVATVIVVSAASNRPSQPHIHRILSCRCVPSPTLHDTVLTHTGLCHCVRFCGPAPSPQELKLPSRSRPAASHPSSCSSQTGPSRTPHLHSLRYTKFVAPRSAHLDCRNPTLVSSTRCDRPPA